MSSINCSRLSSCARWGNNAIQVLCLICRYLKKQSTSCIIFLRNHLRPNACWLSLIICIRNKVTISVFPPFGICLSISPFSSSPSKKMSKQPKPMYHKTRFALCSDSAFCFLDLCLFWSRWGWFYCCYCYCCFVTAWQFLLPVSGRICWATVWRGGSSLSVSALSLRRSLYRGPRDVSVWMYPRSALTSCSASLCVLTYSLVHPFFR